jgi:hypothetical protein
MQLAMHGTAMGDAKLPTNLTARSHPVHRWFNFIAGFSPEFVASCIVDSPGVTDGYVLDPFAGAGTTLVEAQMCGLPAVGYEPHPFFAEMARAKLATDLTCDDLDSLEQVLLGGVAIGANPGAVWSETPLTFLVKLLPEKSLAQLASVPLLAEEIEPRLLPMFRLIGSKVLESAAGAQTDGIYKAPTSQKRPRDVAASVRSVCAMVREDLALLGPAARSDAVIVGQSSSDGIAPGASLCVTSPPYLNNFDFAEMTRMELYFWRLAESWREITDLVRSKLLVNTTTAPRDRKLSPDTYIDQLPGELFAAASVLYGRVAAASKGRSKDYHRLVFPYIHGLFEVFANCREALQDGANIHVIVADSAFYGVHVPLHDLTAMSLRLCGFEDVAVRHLRERGDRWVLAKRQGPPGKLGEYWISGVR